MPHSPRSITPGVIGDHPQQSNSLFYLVSVAEKRQPPHVILSEAKNLSHIEILRFAQDDKTGFRNRNYLSFAA
jgi:hypothetical protein